MALTKKSTSSKPYLLNSSATLARVAGADLVVLAGEFEDADMALAHQVGHPRDDQIFQVIGDFLGRELCLACRPASSSSRASRRRETKTCRSFAAAPCRNRDRETKSAASFPISGPERSACRRSRPGPETATSPTASSAAASAAARWRWSACGGPGPNLSKAWPSRKNTAS